MILDIRDLRSGHHCCLLYNNTAEQMATVIPFFQEGLTRRERCLYVADEQTIEAVETALNEHGIDVRALSGQGALHFLTKYDTFLRYGRFEPPIMVEFMDKLINQAIQQGFRGLRFACEMTWALSVGCEGLIEYEAIINKWHSKWRAVSLCQYNRTKFTVQLQRDVLKTHPLAVVDEKLLPNFYYEPPELFLGTKPEASRVEWMLANLQRGRPNLNGDTE